MEKGEEKEGERTKREGEDVKKNPSMTDTWIDWDT